MRQNAAILRGRFGDVDENTVRISSCIGSIDTFSSTNVLCIRMNTPPTSTPMRNIVGDMIFRTR